MTRLGVVYPTRVSIWRREQRAKLLVEALSTNSFDLVVVVEGEKDADRLTSLHRCTPVAPQGSWTVV